MACSDRVRDKAISNQSHFSLLWFFLGGEVSAWEGKIGGEEGSLCLRCCLVLIFPVFLFPPKAFFLLTVDVPPPPMHARRSAGSPMGGEKGLCLLFPFRPKRERPRGL